MPEMIISISLTTLRTRTNGPQDAVVVFGELAFKLLQISLKSPVDLKLSATLLEPLPIATSNLVF